MTEREINKLAELISSKMLKANDRFMDRKAAAEYLCLSVSSLKQNKKIPCFKKDGKVFYRQSELYNYMMTR